MFEYTMPSYRHKQSQNSGEKIEFFSQPLWLAGNGAAVFVG